LEKARLFKIKAILFDLDDTLYEEMQFVEGGFRAVSSFISENSNIHRDVFYQLLLEVLEEHGRGHTFDIALKKLGLYKEELISRLIEVYCTHKPNLLLYPEVKLVLLRLKEMGYQLGLITDGNVQVQRSKIQALDIDGFFDCIMFSDEYGVERRKPDFLPYEKTLEKLRVNPNESVYVGDNPHKDFITAKKLGMCTVRVMKGQYKQTHITEEYEANYQIQNLEEILNFTFIPKMQKKFV